MKMMMCAMLAALLGAVVVSADENALKPRRLQFVPPPQPFPLGQELILNGDFTSGLQGWSTYIRSRDNEGQSDNDIFVDESIAFFQITAPSSRIWHIQLYQTILAISENTEIPYIFSADFQTQGGTREVELVVEQNQANDNWTAYGRTSCTIGPAVSRCSVEAFSDSPGPLKFAIMGGASEVDFSVDNVSATFGTSGGPDPTVPPAAPIAFVNGDFSQGFEGWSTFTSARAGEIAGIQGNDFASFDFDDVLEEPWLMQLYQTFDIPAVPAVPRYLLTCDIIGRLGGLSVNDEGERVVQLYAQQAASPWIEFASSPDGDCVAFLDSVTTCSLEISITNKSLPVKFGVQPGIATGPFTVDSCSIKALN